MINWSTDEKTFKKRYPKQHKLWRLTQLINFGLDGEKLDADQVRAAWPKIKARVNPDKKKVIEFYLWNKKWHREPGLLPNRSNFWIWRFANHTS